MIFILKQYSYRQCEGQIRSGEKLNQENELGSHCDCPGKYRGLLQWHMR